MSHAMPARVAQKAVATIHRFWTRPGLDFFQTHMRFKLNVDVFINL